MVIGMIVMLSEVKRKGLDTDKALDLTIYTIIASVIGARLYYIIAFNLKYYISNPLEVFALRSGGLSIQGGLIAGIGFALIYTKIKKISFWKTADAFAPAIIIGQAIGRIGCDVFGRPMGNSYPWGVMVNSQLLHPVQLYEAGLNLLLFIYLMRKRSKVKYNGELFIKYIIGFSLIRGFVEFFRFNPIVVGPFTVVHVTSLIIIIITLIINNKIKKNQSVLKIINEEAINIPLLHFILIALLGAFSIWFYYFIHG
ncbi:prolipoprotein diacylglyceryl transferase [Oceanirhabdus sp. W0125-5]|uniref:prolipoprotein diacylglyceryl transferase n=1 Tax=Oceanirhabdus sp. W0125-5 TaxID=2999116 RepID=UPI0022F2C891|nr:prolipoprotein diacylglyceryl transferase [Oceanirhabdus sp. W0125-5]WBW95021.1 prolipoprotein diacylglyceryl transferase [Oceanirhabdus sp. W0125-5]